MSAFKLQYVILAILLVAGIGGSLSTLLGGDPRIGAFSAGATLGLMIAMSMLRVTELRLAATSSLAPLNFHNSQANSGYEELQNAPVSQATPSNGATPALREFASLNPISNIVIFEPVSDATFEPEFEQSAQVGPVAQEPALCSCVCGCKWKSKSSKVNLCGNCNRWWRIQRGRCKCAYISTGDCTCAAIKHEPGRQFDHIANAA